MHTTLERGREHSYRKHTVMTMLLSGGGAGCSLKPMQSVHTYIPVVLGIYWYWRHSLDHIHVFYWYWWMTNTSLYRCGSCPTELGISMLSEFFPVCNYEKKAIDHWVFVLFLFSYAGI